jgi:hypothetical protein
VTGEIATYRRLRAALRAARDASAVSVFVGSTELNLPDAAAYAQQHMLSGGLHGVWIAQRVGRLEIGPERRTSSERRSGLDRRSIEQDPGLWAERRTNPDRRQGAERRVPAGPVWEAA